MEATKENDVLVSKEGIDESGDEFANPFGYDTPVDEYELFKIAFFMGSGIAALRFVLVILCLLTAITVANIATIGLSHEAAYTEPLTPLRYKLLSPVRYLARAILFILGYYSITIKGTPDPRACFYTPNHCGLMDAVIMTYLCLPASVARHEVTKLPLFGGLARGGKIIPVVRESKEGREWTSKVMERFGESRSNPDPNKRFPPILIFPQGTTTNMRFLTMFQRGAFLPGLPVQPVGINYKYKHFNPAFVTTREKDYYYRRHFCQFVCHMEVEFLPIHIPNEAEKADATLFANNVRDEIAAAIGATKTAHFFEDARLYLACMKYHEEKHVVHLLEEPDESDKIQLSKFKVRHVKKFLEPNSVLSDVQEAVRIFSKIDRNNDGQIDFEEFCEATGYDAQTDQAKTIFEFFDTDDSGSVDLKELVIGMAVCSREVSSTEKARFAFDLYDTNKDGTVTASELLNFASGLSAQGQSIVGSSTTEFLDMAEKSGAPKDENGEIILDWPTFEKLVLENEASVGVVTSAIKATLGQTKRALVQQEIEHQ